MDLKDGKRSRDLLSLFSLPEDVKLAEIFPSAGRIFGYLKGTRLAKVPISSVLGDQHAALLGHGCTEKGMIKNTYGTGCFLLCNTGEECIIPTERGLISTFAYQLGDDQPPKYALEAPIAGAGSTLEWIKNKLGLIKDVREIDDLSPRSSHRVKFVPALSGLLAPYWDADCRGAFLGLTLNTDRSQLLRAVIDAIAFSNRRAIELIQEHVPIKQPLTVDGGLTNSRIMMQTQSDALGLRLARPLMSEVTAFGAARAAAYTLGEYDWASGREDDSEVYHPEMSLEQEYQDWLEALEMVCKLR